VIPVPASPAALQPAPSVAVLGSAEVGLPLVASTDGITAAEAANEVPDAAAALPLFDSWDWLTEARRSFRSGPVSVGVTVLLTLRSSGAESAFGFLSEQTSVPPLIASACPVAVVGVDECAFAQGGGRELVVGRVGDEVFLVATSSTDAVRLAVVQASRLHSSPPP
jgi:hypothetical protein